MILWYFSFLFRVTFFPLLLGENERLNSNHVCMHAHACTHMWEFVHVCARAYTHTHTQAFRSAYGFHIFLNRAVYRAATKSEELECETYHIWSFWTRILLLLLLTTTTIVIVVTTVEKHKSSLGWTKFWLKVWKLENWNLGLPTPELTALRGRACGGQSTTDVSNSSLGPPIAASNEYVCQSLSVIPLEQVFLLRPPQASALQ